MPRSEPETKLSQLAAAAHKGDWQGALRIAARFQDLGDDRSDIKRAHEAHSNPDFYSQLGHNPAALIAAGIAALKRRYPKQLATLIEETEMTTTQTTTNALPHSVNLIGQLTATLTGGGFKRAKDKETAIVRFVKVAAEKGIDGTAAASVLHSADPVAALTALLQAKLAPATEVVSIPGGEPNRFKAVKKADKPAKAPKAPKEPKPAKAAVAKAPAAPKPEGKRAAAIAAAERGEVPEAPDFTAETHKAWRKKLAEVVALVEARDIVGLKANTVEPKSSSRKQICTYRDHAIKALEAQAAAAK